MEIRHFISQPGKTLGLSLRKFGDSNSNCLSYLFALVAGDLSCIKDTFTTMSGRKVDLHIYVQHHNADKCAHALKSLKQAMKWDEEVYGREYGYEPTLPND